MIIIDVRKFGKKLTLQDCAVLYDQIIEMYSPFTMKLGYKGKVIFLPDKVWVTQWQADTLFSSTTAVKVLGAWRCIPIEVMEPIE